jgi:phytoene/squalene synthetase
VTDDPERTVSQPKARFEEVVSALIRIGKDEVKEARRGLEEAAQRQEAVPAGAGPEGLGQTS